MEDEVAFVAFIAEGVGKVLRLNMVPHVGLGSKCKTADSATSCTNFISRNKLVKVLKFLDTSLNQRKIRKTYFASYAIIFNNRKYLFVVLIIFQHFNAKKLSQFQTLNSVFLAFMDDKGFIRVEDKVTLRTFIAEGVWKVFGLNVVPHIALVCKRKTTDSATS